MASQKKSRDRSQGRHLSIGELSGGKGISFVEEEGKKLVMQWQFQRFKMKLMGKQGASRTIL